MYKLARRLLFTGLEMRGLMKVRASFVPLQFVLLALVFFLLATPVGAQNNSGGKEGQPKTDSKTSAMTGCIDEQGGHYVLVEDRNMTPIADLIADGFPTEGFAKHMGHKVTVRGTTSASGNESRPTFKVRSIDTVSQTCAPQ